MKTTNIYLGMDRDISGQFLPDTVSAVGAIISNSGLTEINGCSTAAPGHVILTVGRASYNLPVGMVERVAKIIRPD